MAELLDSGNRTEFDTGAVRDIQDGKGRPSLVPLSAFNVLVDRVCYDNVLDYVEAFKKTGKKEYLYSIMTDVCSIIFPNKYKAILELGKHFEDGAKKYGEENWKKGIPVNRYVDSMIRHYCKWKCGYEDEPHDRAFLWNVVCCIWTIENIPEMNVYQKAR